METTIAAGADNSKALAEEVKHLESARQLEKDLLEACERELEDLERLADEANKAGIAVSLANAELKGELWTLQAAYRALELLSGRLTKEAEEHEKKVARTRNAMGEVDKELQQVETRTWELERRLEQGQKKALLMREQKQAAEGERDIAKAALAPCDARIKELIQELECHKAAHARCAAQVKMFNAHVAPPDQKQAEYLKQEGALLEQQKATHASALTREAQLERSPKRIPAELQAVERSQTEDRWVMACRDAEIDSLRGRLEAAEKNLEEEFAEHQVLKSKYERLKDKLWEAHQRLKELARAEADCDKLSQELACVVQEREEIRQQLLSVEERSHQLMMCSAAATGEAGAAAVAVKIVPYALREASTRTGSGRCGVTIDIPDPRESAYPSGRVDVGQPALALGRATCSRELNESSFECADKSAALTLSAATNAGVSKELEQRAVMKLLADEAQRRYVVKMQLFRARMQVRNVCMSTHTCQTSCSCMWLHV